MGKRGQRAFRLLYTIGGRRIKKGQPVVKRQIVISGSKTTVVTIKAKKE